MQSTESSRRDTYQSKDAVVRFTGQNYKAWSFKMKCRLKKDGLWRVTSGDTLRPTSIPKDESSSARTSRLEMEAKERAKDATKETPNEKWDAANDEAYSLIALSLADEYVHKIQNTDDAKQAWDTMEREYKASSDVDLNFWEEKFQGMSMKDKENPVTFANNVENAAMMVNGIAPNSLPDDKISRKIINGLSPKYKYLVASLESMNQKDISSAYIVGRLRTEVLRDRKETPEKKEKAFTTQETNNGKSNHKGGRFKGKAPGGGNHTKGNEKRKFTGKCYNCNKTGHLSRDCNAPRKERTDNNAKTGEKAHSTHETNFTAILKTYQKEEAYLARELEEEYIVDSGASKHMTGDISHLSEYAPHDGQPVFVELGDKTALPVAGMGILRFKIHNGTTISIHDVLYVPRLARNLLSVSQASESGIDVTFGERSVMLSHQGWTLLRGTRDQNLYSVKLQPIRSQYSCNMAHETRPATLTTWHQRFAHAGMSTLRNMAKKNVVSGFKFQESDVKHCEPCELGKNARLPISKEPFNSSHLAVAERIGSRHPGTLQDSYT